MVCCRGSSLLHTGVYVLENLQQGQFPHVLGLQLVKNGAQICARSCLQGYQRHGTSGTNPRGESNPGLAWCLAGGAHTCRSVTSSPTPGRGHDKGRRSSASAKPEATWQRNTVPSFETDRISKSSATSA
mmetsp:Transcript_40378/g.114312  ORF Transcript_40378/g.114312 Transcript_40378/m.114312 type:complete len:129 (-) Transcript_40378:54-440(-)